MPFHDPMNSSPSDIKRLATALLVSCFLHEALVLVFFYDSTRHDSTFSASSADANSSPLHARLMPSQKRSLSLTSSSKGISISALDPSPAQNAEPGSDQFTPPTPPHLSLTELEFFTADQLTQRPRPEGEVNLDVPEALLLTQTGSLVLSLWINSVGKVVSISYEASELPEAFTTAIGEVFSQVRFIPGEIHGRPVNSILRIEIAHQEEDLNF
jgi:hypothetical protein